MTVEREIAGFALPFAAGTAAAVYAWTSCGNIFSASAILTGTAIVWILLLLPERKKWPPAIIHAVIALLAAGTGALCGIRACETSVSNHEEGSITAFAGQYGEVMKNAADSIPFDDKRTNSFVKAVLTGERKGMSREVTEAFRESGASHILALSGLHLGVIYMMISRLMSVIGSGIRAGRFKSFLTIMLCGFYTLATGAGPSLVRAFLFITINETARHTGRIRSTGNTLMAALIIHLCISPSDIRSVGFQLSYAAMAGIAFIYPRLKRIWPEDKEGGTGRFMTIPIKWIWNSAAMSVSCQLTTGPIAFFYFGTFPKYFLLTNLIALPLTGLLIPVSAVTMILHHAGICPDLLIRGNEWLCNLLIEALEVISSM